MMRYLVLPLHPLFQKHSSYIWIVSPIQGIYKSWIFKKKKIASKLTFENESLAMKD